DLAVQRIEEAQTDVIVLNLANADMVGHTGRFQPTVEACRVVDQAVGRIHAACRPSGSLLVVTADHGNAEQMIDPLTGQPHTAHTTHQVPAIFVREDLVGARLAPGAGLSSVLPTILQILQMDIPPDLDEPLLL
ncbi:MAG: 2,3-bisphosphoglycerate-independent phosphoglycerate mutase, partial [Acidobacteriota bacterium]